LPASEGANSSNTLVFALHTKCEAKKGTTKLNLEDKFKMEPDLLYTGHQVFSGDFRFRPFGDQSDTFGPSNLPSPVHDDILLAKLRPGQEIMCEAHCEKGIGRDHAKWSPVGKFSTRFLMISGRTSGYTAKASYRLLPLISVSAPIANEDCDLFKACFPAGVVDFQEAPGNRTHKIVKIVNARKDTVSREILRHPQFSDVVTLGRRRDHFICKSRFSASSCQALLICCTVEIESIGQFAPSDLLPQAIAQVFNKIQEMRVPVNKICSAT
jgi:DNA-directed RNA polymerase I and III subunit RPAC1